MSEFHAVRLAIYPIIWFMLFSAGCSPGRDGGDINLSNKLLFAIDESEVWDVSRHETYSKMEWIESRGPYLDIGHTKKYVWILIDLESQIDSYTHKEGYIVLQWKTLDYVDFYDWNQGKPIYLGVSGDRYPKSQWVLPNSHFPALWLPYDSQPRKILIRLKSKNFIRFPIYWESELDYAFEIRNVQTISAIYTLISLVLVGFGITQFIQSRDSTYIFYILYIITLGIHFTIRFGMSYTYFWPESPWLENNMGEVTVSLQLAFFFYFTRRMFQMKANHPRSYWFTKVLEILMLASITWHVYLDYYKLGNTIWLFLSYFYTYIYFITVTFFWWFTITNWKSHTNHARIFMFGWYFYSVFVILNILYLYKIVPFHLLTAYGLVLVYPIDIIFFYWSLHSKQKAILEELRMLREFKSKMEYEVSQKKAVLSEPEKRESLFRKWKGPVELEPILEEIEKRDSEILSTEDVRALFYQALSKNLHLSPSISLENFAKYIGIHRNQFSDFINKEFQMNFSRVMNVLRIEEAKKRIETSNEKNFLEIAFEVGYNSKSNFNQSFKEITGVTPLEYKKNYLNQSKNKI
jgi:AraC-like DNA-binding protein